MLIYKKQRVDSLRVTVNKGSKNIWSYLANLLRRYWKDLGPVGIAEEATSHNVADIVMQCQTFPK